MRIAAITLREAPDRPALELTSITRGLNAVVGPSRAGKTAIVDFLSYALFGKSPRQLSTTGQGFAPAAEVIVEGDAGRFRVRRLRDASGAVRLTLAALDGSAADQKTIQKLVGELPPAVLSRLCAVNFRELPDIAELLSPAFSQGWLSGDGANEAGSGRRTVELAARRDLLAQELESRIAGERRVSKELETRWREIDRLIRDEKQSVAGVEQRLKNVEGALAETDIRLRYRRLELDVDLQWQPAERSDPESELSEMDAQISRWRLVLAELAEREAGARARLGHIESSRVNSRPVVAEQRSWLAVARQLAADLSGEVARLARASASEQCVCRDAHPRLRPIAETIERQLQALEVLIAEQQGVLGAADLRIEVDHLAGAQAEMRRHVDHLLDRREALIRGSAASRDDAKGNSPFSAADAEQLETRRLELEQQRFDLVEQLRSRERVLSDLRDECSEVERQRASLLSARSIEHVQRELAAVQLKLEQASSDGGPIGDGIGSTLIPPQAADFLAQLTDGELVRLSANESNGRAYVVNRAGETLATEALTPAQRDLVYVSVCLALILAASRQGVRLPLVLDEPFERLDPRSTAALAAILEDFGRSGHQVLVFTGRQEAVARLSSVGAAMHDLIELRRHVVEHSAAPPAVLSNNPDTSPSDKPKRKPRRQTTTGRQKKTEELPQPLNTPTTEVDRSDAA